MSRFQATRLIFFAVCLAILARAVIPTGFMPDFDNGAFKMVICTNDGQSVQEMDAKYNPFAPVKHTVQKLCDFGLTQHMAVVMASSAQIVFLLWAGFAVFIVLRTQSRYRLRHYNPGNPRAPPVSV